MKTGRGGGGCPADMIPLFREKKKTTTMSNVFKPVLLCSFKEKFLVFGGLTPNINQAQSRDQRVSLFCLCLCLQQHSGKRWRIFSKTASVRKCVIFVTIPPENKVYLSVKRQRFTIMHMDTEKL